MNSIIDKKALLPLWNLTDKHVLEVGCGDLKRLAGSIGIDIADYPAVDIVGDAVEVMKLIPAVSVDLIQSSHFMEHIADVPAILNEFTRSLKIGGQIDITVPHFSNPFYYSDPTHKSFFGLYTFAYYAENKIFKRTVPSYSRIEGLELVSVHLGMKSYPPRYVRHGFKKLLEMLFNSSTFMRELYEENLCYLFPCYEIRYVLRRNK